MEHKISLRHTIPRNAAYVHRLDPLDVSLSGFATGCGDGTEVRHGVVRDGHASVLVDAPMWSATLRPILSLASVMRLARETRFARVVAMPSEMLLTRRKVIRLVYRDTGPRVIRSCAD